MSKSTFHIRDRDSGLYYVGQYPYRASFYYESRTAVNGQYRPWNWKAGQYIETVVGDTVFQYAKRGYGKPFKDLGKLKSRISYLLGIQMPPKWLRDKEDAQHTEFTRLVAERNLRWNDPEYEKLRNELNAETDLWHQMHPGYESIPEWMNNPDPCSVIPETWEAVEVRDKQTKDLCVLDINLHQYGNDLQRLRVLTDTFGSAVKDVYKKLEKKAQIAEFKNVVTIITNEDLRDLDPYWDKDKFKPDTTRIDEVIEQMGLKRKDYVRSSKEFSTAIAFKSEANAVMFRLAYTGNYKVSLIDLEKLVEVAEGAPTDDKIASL